MLNNSHIYHQMLHDIKKRGIDVEGVKLNLLQMLKAKDDSVVRLSRSRSRRYRKDGRYPRWHKSDWRWAACSRIDSEVVVVEFPKVLFVEKKDGRVFVTTEAAKDGKLETLEADVVLVAIGRRPYIQGLGPENIGVEVGPRGRILIDDQFNMSVLSIKCIGDITFGPILAHKAEEGIAAAEYIHSGHGHVNLQLDPER